jgi:hypothetical protein
VNSKFRIENFPTGTNSVRNGRTGKLQNVDALYAKGFKLFISNTLRGGDSQIIMA